MKIRPAASSLPFDEVMRSKVVEIADRAALMAYLREHYAFWSPNDANVTCRPYCFDPRNRWDTHLVSVDGNAALFTDGPLP
jgi:hypothetical protein